MEKWDILNADGEFVGKTTLRGKCNMKPGEYHLVVHIWVLSSRGDILIQRRSENKKLMPGEWAATGGAAISGEDSYTAANRELYEELGIPSNKHNLKKIARIKRRNSLLDIWFITTDIPSEKLRLQKDEVAEAQWITREEFVDMIENGNFHNYGKDYFDLILKTIDEHTGVTV
ncbi:MAG: NUDIX domain-containing protein [Clostridia bacterium]|nr:NUDIX domain-containing protein [Clostridia bacterium]